MKFLPVPVQQSPWTMRRRPGQTYLVSFCCASLGLVLVCKYLLIPRSSHSFRQPSINFSNPTEVCKKTFVYKFDNCCGFASELALYVRTAMTATHLNYAMFYDDSQWQYGPMSKYFKTPSNPCVLPKDWVNIPRTKFGNQGWMNASHLTNNRRELHVKHIDEYIVKNLVNQESIDLIASWNFINARNEKTSIPIEQVLHQSMRDVFERQSMELNKLWKPTDSLLREVDTMQVSVKESIHQHISEGPFSIWRRIGIRWETKKIGIYYNTRSDIPNATNKTQSSDPEIESWYHYTTHQYYRVIKSIQDKLKLKPVIFLLSDNLESAFTSIATYMLQFPIEKQYNLIVAPDSHSVDPFSEPHPDKKRKEDRIDDVADYVRDLTFAVEHLDVITCSLEQSETCDLIFLLGGSKRAMGKNPTIRSIDQRWYPTSSRASIDELALGLSNSHEKLVELAQELAKEPKNYVHF